MRIFVCTNEISGDLLGARLVEELKAALGPRVQFSGIGSDRLAAAGVEILADFTPLSTVGIAEASRNALAWLPAWLGGFSRILRQAKPDLALYISCPGMNLWVGAMGKRRGIPSIYFLPPEVSLHGGRRRAGKIARLFDLFLCHLESDHRLYARSGAASAFIGHPLPETIPNLAPRLPTPGEIRVALFPGSRPHEVRRHLPTMLEACRTLDNGSSGQRFHFSIASASALLERIMRPVARRFELDGLEIVDCGPRHGRLSLRILAESDLALVKMGTTTLEAALLDVPTIAFYRLHRLSEIYVRVRNWLSGGEFLPRRFAIPNILVGRDIVPELVQRQFTPPRLAAEARRLLFDPQARQRMLEGFAEVRRAARAQGAYARAVQDIVAFATKRGLLP